jgi:tetratricopeptide (TPR) repeat protein
MAKHSASNTTISISIFFVLILSTNIYISSFFSGVAEGSNMSDQNNDDIVLESSMDLGNKYLNQGNYTEAIKYYDKALVIDPNYVSVLNSKGVALKNLGNYTEAIKYYDKALAIDPNYVNALHNKGVVLDNLGNYTEAITYYDKALAIDPNRVETLNNKGVVFYDLRNYSEAISYYDKGLTIDPNYTLSLNNKGNAIAKLVESTVNITPVFFNFNDGSDSININHNYDNHGFFQTSFISASVFPNLDSYFYLTGTDISNHNYNYNYYPVFVATAAAAAAASTLGFEDAIKAYDKVLVIDPNDIDTLTNKGIVLIKMQKYDDAIAIFNKVLEIEPEHVPSLYNMGSALEGKGERYDGSLYKNKALELDSQYKPDYINQVATAVDITNDDKPQPI